MTNYEHLMLSVSFGCNLGWILGGLYLMVRELIIFIKDKINARREKKADNNM